jgi:hypothetical protein
MGGVAANQARYASGPACLCIHAPSIPGLLLLSFFSAVLLLFIHQKFNAEMKQFNHYNVSYSYSSRVLECHALFREMGACLSRVSKCSSASYHLRLHPNNPSRPLYGPLTHLPPDPKHPTIPSYLTTSVFDRVPIFRHSPRSGQTRFFFLPATPPNSLITSSLQYSVPRPRSMRSEFQINLHLNDRPLLMQKGVNGPVGL